MRVLEYELTTEEMLDMRGPTPLAVQIRFRLNEEGFKFEDDGKFSSLTNENPKPLGKMLCWKDCGTGSSHYKQYLEES